MALSFEQFFRGISEQESGGRYNAVGVPVNGNRAYGKYQVMDFNIPSWTRAYYGRSLTPSQFLSNPKAQEAVARGKLKSYWNKYGARGAAAAWYSGNPNLNMSTRSQYGGPSVKSYVDQVLAKASKYSSGGGGGSTGLGQYSGGAIVSKLSDAELAEQYGFVSSFLNSNKELKSLFKQAVSGGWAAAKFQAKLRNTKWWKTHGKDEREYLLKLKADPATAREEKKAADVKAHQIGNALGIRVTDFTKKKLGQAAYNIVAKGWNDEQVRYYLGQYVFFGDVQQGQGGEIWDELHQYAYSMGVTKSGQWYADNSRNVVRGVATIQDYKNAIKKQAKSQFAQWSKEIDGGQSVADLAQPYMQSMAQILELPAGSVNLFDAPIKKALVYTNPTNLKKEARPLWQFERDLRNDPRWKRTKNAQDSTMQVAHQVLTDFGLKF